MQLHLLQYLQPFHGGVSLCVAISWLKTPISRQQLTRIAVDSWCWCMLKVIPRGLTADEELVVRQAFAGLCWSKQFYYFDGSSLSSSGMSHGCHATVF